MRVRREFLEGFLQPVNFLLAKADAGPLVDVAIVQEVGDLADWLGLRNLFGIILASWLLGTELSLHEGVVGIHLLANLLIVPHVAHLQKLLNVELVLVLEQK